MSGRGLGFTGGTVDKLESIPGYRTEIEEDEFINNVKDIGISVIAQTKSIAPADKKIYALRDTINCVGNIPLIASSIMSKKIASGADKIVLDVTVGKGAFMKNKDQAEKLAKTMIDIGKLSNRETICVLTNMNEPLGASVGNTLEVIEAIECLKGNIPEDVKQVVLELGAYMLRLSGKYTDIEDGKKAISETIENGKALEKFIQLVERQGGDSEYIRNTEKFEKAKYILPVKANKDGYIEELHAEKIAKVSCNLGSGRIKKEDKIDNAVGIVLNKKVGDKVQNGEIVAYIHANDSTKGNREVKEMEEIIKITDKQVQKENTIISVIC